MDKCQKVESEKQKGGAGRWVGGFLAKIETHLRFGSNHHCKLEIQSSKIFHRCFSHLAWQIFCQTGTHAHHVWGVDLISIRGLLHNIMIEPTNQCIAQFAWGELLNSLKRIGINNGSNFLFFQQCKRTQSLLADTCYISSFVMFNYVFHFSLS